MLGVVGSNLTIFKLESSTPNIVQQSQHGGQTHSKLRPKMLPYVALPFCNRSPGHFKSKHMESRSMHLVSMVTA